MRLALAATIAVLVAAAPPAAGAFDRELGAYERQALETALSRRGLELETEPAGKTIGDVHVVNLDVFSERDGFLQWFNIFHITTRAFVIEREVLLGPGDLWDSEIAEETRRKIDDSLYTTLVVVAPVKNGSPDRVDLLVVTRDIWSLRLNTNYTYQESTLTDLSFALSENNILGFRKTVAFAFVMDLGDIFLGPTYIDKNLAGTRLRMSSQAGVIIGRESGELEGHRSATGVEYPLWSLRSKWGGEVNAGHFVGKVRFFSGTELDTYDNPDTPVEELVPRVYDRTTFAMNESVVRRWKHDDLIQQLRVGHSFSEQNNVVPDDFMFDPVTEAAFERDILPRSERVSAVFARYALFFNRFKVFRNVDTFELPEDIRLGPGVELELSSAFEALGSDENFQSGSISLSYAAALSDDSRLRLAGSVAGRLDENPDSGELELIDNVTSGAVFVAGPTLLDAFRLVGEAAIAARINETNNGFLALGGSNGLRGYVINEFTGQIRVRGNLELRTAPVKIWFTRFGAAAFYDVGHAADTFDELSLKHDVGFGIRTLTPQLQPFVFRFDYAVPLSTGNRTAAGFPGKFIATIRQAF